MQQEDQDLPRVGRGNRRGCFVFVGTLVLLLAALAFIGFRADPIDDVASKIPVPQNRN